MGIASLFEKTYETENKKQVLTEIKTIFPKYRFISNDNFQEIFEGGFDSQKRITKKSLETIHRVFDIHYSDELKNLKFDGFFNLKIPKLILKTSKPLSDRDSNKNRLIRGYNDFKILNKIWNLKNHGIDDWRINLFPKPYFYLGTKEKEIRSDSHNYFFMEHINGSNLQALMNMRYIQKILNVKILEDLYFELIEAIDFLNNDVEYIVGGVAESLKGKIFHRDIKLGNILWLNKPQKIKTQDGLITSYIKVIDFNVSQFKESSTTHQYETGNIGTRPYIPPEKSKDFTMTFGADWNNNVNLNEHKNHRWDLYSLGVVMYQIITDENLKINEFNLKNGTHIKDIKSLKYIKEDIPEDLLNMIYKSITINPENSYNNVKELKEDFKKYKKLRDCIEKFTQDTYNDQKLIYNNLNSEIFDYVSDIDFLNIYSKKQNLKKLLKFKKIFKYVKKLDIYRSNSRVERKNIKKTILLFVKNNINIFQKEYDKLKQHNLLTVKKVNEK